MEQLWYYAAEGQQCGPISLDELRGRVTANWLRPDDLVWSSGMESWQSAGSVPGLLPQTPAPPAVSSPPPVKGRSLFPKVAGVLLVLAVTGLVAATMLWTKVRSPDIDDLIDIMPQATTVLVAVRGFVDLAYEFGLLQSAGALSTPLSEISESLNLDLSDRTALLTTGIDLLEPMGIGIYQDSAGHETTLWFIPAADTDRLGETFRRMAEGKGWAVESEPYQGTAIAKVGRGNLSYVAHRGYVVVAHDAELSPTAPLLKRLVDGELGSVKTAEWFSSMEPLVDGSWHALGLLSPALLASFEEKFLNESIPWAGGASSDSRFSSLAGLGGSLELDADAIRVRYYEASPEGRVHALSLPAIPGEDQFAPRVAGPALGAVRISVDLEGFLRWQEGNLPDPVVEGFRELASSWSFDVLRDLAPHLDAPMALAVVEDEASELSVGVVAWAPLKPGHDVDTFLAKIAEAPQAKQQVDGETWYRLGNENNVAWVGVSHAHVVWVFLSSPERMLASGSGESMIASMKRKESRSNFLSGHDAAFYVDLEGLGSAFGEPIVPAEGKTLLDALGEMEIWVDAEDGMLLSEWVLHPSRRDGFAELAAKLAQGR